jgi:hypothetical protein
VSVPIGTRKPSSRSSARAASKPGTDRFCAPPDLAGHARTRDSAKRGCELAAFLADHVLEDVPHAQWVFTIPKMLRPLFFRKRELRGVLARLAWQTVRDLMAAAVEEPDLRPGMVSVLQTFGDRINPHPHVHAVVSRGGWTRDDRFVPIPYVDPHAAQRLFAHKVFAFLQRNSACSSSHPGSIRGFDSINAPIDAVVSGCRHSSHFSLVSCSRLSSRSTAQCVRSLLIFRERMR